MDKTTTNKPYKLGLSLSGGGAKGFAHVGVFKLLEEYGLRPDVIAGTSVGALMGVLFADGYSADEIKELFTGREFSEFAQLQLPKAGIFDSGRFRHFLKHHLRAKRFEDLKTQLVVVTTNLDHGEIHEFRTGPLLDPIVASCSIPIVFNPVKIDGTYYVDGGLFKNFPVSTIRVECDRIIGVNVSPLISVKYKQSIMSIAERSYHYMFRANTIKDRELCDLLIEAEEFGMYNTFDIENVELISNTGYNAGKRSFEQFIQENIKDPILKAIETNKS